MAGVPVLVAEGGRSAGRIVGAEPPHDLETRPIDGIRKKLERLLARQAQGRFGNTVGQHRRRVFPRTRKRHRRDRQHDLQLAPRQSFGGPHDGFDVGDVLRHGRRPHLAVTVEIFPSRRRVQVGEYELPAATLEETGRHAKCEDQDIGVGERRSQPRAAFGAKNLFNGATRAVHSAALDPIQQVPVGVGAVDLFADEFPVNLVTDDFQSLGEIAGEARAERDEDGALVNEGVDWAFAQYEPFDHPAGIGKRVLTEGPVL